MIDEGGERFLKFSNEIRQRNAGYAKQAKERKKMGGAKHVRCAIGSTSPV